MGEVDFRTDVVMAIGLKGESWQGESRNFKEKDQIKVSLVPSSVKKIAEALICSAWAALCLGRGEVRRSVFSDDGQA